MKIDILTSRSKKKGIKVYPNMAGRETDNFTILDNEQDTDIEPAPQDEWDMEVKQEAE